MSRVFTAAMPRVDAVRRWRITEYLADGRERLAAEFRAGEQAAYAYLAELRASGLRCELLCRVWWGWVCELAPGDPRACESSRG